MPCWMLLMIGELAGALLEHGEVELLRALRDFLLEACDHCALSSATAAWLASIARRSRSASWKRPNAPSMSAYR